MLSGTDLIRTAGQIQERAQRLRAVEDVKAVESPAESKPGLDEDTKNALLRFARFINQEDGKKKQPRKPLPKGLPKAYLDQIELTSDAQRSGEMLNVSV